MPETLPTTLESVVRDVIPVLEDILEEERIEPDECAAIGGFALCGATPCQQAGCIVDKLKRAKSALASLQPSVSEMRPNEEVERWALAYEMAHEQAMANGASAARYKAALERLLGGDLDVSGTALILSNNSAEAREIIASARSALSPEGEP